jgi:uncharacterized protein YdhG (YjbR/CyaY superfamily)
LPQEQRVVLEQLRQTIRAIVPDAAETISYGVPTFKQRKAVVAIGAAKNHCSLFVMSPAVMEAHQEELAGYDTSKGTVRFAPEKPLPAALVTKLVRARIAENDALALAAKARRRANKQTSRKESS